MNFYGTSLALLARNNGCIMDFLTEEYIHSSPGAPKADWKNNTDQTYSCLRDCMGFQSWGSNTEHDPSETPRIIAELTYSGAQGGT